MTNSKRVIDFMGQRKLAFAFSIVMMVGSIGSLVVNGLQLGLDFTGGTLVEVSYSDVVELGDVRTTLADAGYKKAVVVYFGSESDVLVRLPQSVSGDLGNEVLQALQANYAGEITLRRTEYVGPQVGEELREQGGLGMLIALIGVMIYVAFRFQFKFSIGAVVALVHDVVITLGIFSIMRWDFDLTVLAAILAVIGYSLNDTIVVSDRIRENFRKLRKGTPSEVVNISITQTLGRTIVTGLTTLLVLFALFFYGGELIRGFASALIIGIVIGTYSSIYTASSILITMSISREDLLVPVKEGGEIDDGRP